MSKWVNNITKFIILGIWTLIAVFLFGTSIIQTIDLVNFDVFYNKDSLILNVVWILIFLIMCILIKRITPDVVKKYLGKNRNKILWCSTILMTIFLCVWIIATQYVPKSDPGDCIASANAFLKGDMSPWIDGYMSLYPFQNGLVFFEVLLIIIFGENAYLAFQFINVLFFLLGVYAIVRTCRYMFKGQGGSLIWLVLLTYYPYAIYVVFTYGIIMGLTLALLSVMWMFEYFEKRKIRYALLCATSITFSIITKANYSIFLIGIILYLLFDAVTKRSKKSVLCVFVTLVIYLVCTKGLDVYVEKATNVPLSKGMPKVSWVAMGLHETDGTTGWWDGYTLYVYAVCKKDYDATVAASMEHIKARLDIIAATPKRFAKFYYKKITSTWNNPNWECFNIQDMKSNTSDNAIKQGVKNENVGFWKALLNVIQTIINAGIMFYIINCWKNIKKTTVYELAYAVIMIGAFCFFILWETKSQYAMPYYYLIIPYAIVGWDKLIKCIYGRIFN